jgi:hypothetical protein
MKLILNIGNVCRSYTLCYKVITAQRPACGHSGSMRSGFERSTNCSCPGGTTENSPAFQRWVWTPGRPSPEGTADTAPSVSRPFGTNVTNHASPNAEALGYFRKSLRDDVQHSSVTSFMVRRVGRLLRTRMSARHFMERIVL